MGQGLLPPGQAAASLLHSAELNAKRGRGWHFMTEADGATGESACHCCSAGGYRAGNEVTMEQTPKPEKVRLTLLPNRQAVLTGTC